MDAFVFNKVRILLLADAGILAPGRLQPSQCRTHNDTDPHRTSRYPAAMLEILMQRMQSCPTCHEFRIPEKYSGVYGTTIYVCIAAVIGRAAYEGRFYSTVDGKAVASAIVDCIHHWGCSVSLVYWKCCGVFYQRYSNASMDGGCSI